MVTGTTLAGWLGGTVGAAGQVAIGWEIAAIVVNLAISSILGKVLAPDLPKDARGNRTYKSTVRNPVLPRRVVYGEAVVGGPYIYLETGTAEYDDDLENELLHMIIALTGHPVEDIIGTFVSEEYVDISGNSVGSSGDSLDSSYFVTSGRFSASEAEGAVKVIKNNGWGYADFNYVTDETATDPLQDRLRAKDIADNVYGWESAVLTPSLATRDSGTGLWSRPSGKFHKVTNCAYIYVRLEALPDIWSGIPQLKFHVKGKRVYNPDKDNALVDLYGATGGSHDLNDPDTWEYSNDWTLCVLDFLINPFYGLGAKASTSDPTDPAVNEIDWEEVINSYAISSASIDNGLSSPQYTTEPTYTIDGVFEVSATPISTMENLLSAGAGELIYSQGVYKIRAGAYRAPASESNIINEDMIVSPLTIQTHTPRADLFNKAAGVYIKKLERDWLGADPGATNNYLFEPADFPIVDPIDSSGTNPYEVIDGEEIITDFDYPFTLSSTMAQRLARIQLERVRRGFTISFEATLEMLKYSVGDTVYMEILDNDNYIGEPFANRLGLDDDVQTQSVGTSPYYKQFKIISMEYTENFTISVMMVEESEAIYDWNEGFANPDENALVSDLYIDDPVGTVLPPSFVVSSPNQTVTEIVVGSDIRTEIRWTPAVRSSPNINEIDRRHIQGYFLEYGIVDNPSEAASADRVSTWIPAGYFTVQNASLDVQGPLAINNLYVDATTQYDFRLKARTTNGRNSAWVYYSESGEIGSDYTPTAPYGTSRYYILATNGTTIHNSTGTLTLEAREITSSGDVLLSSGTIRLYENESPYNEITVANGYAAGSDGFTGVFDSGDINGDIVIALSDGAPNDSGSTLLQAIQLVDISDGAQGNPGQSVKTVNIYRKNSSSINSGSGTYADPLSGNSPDWSYSVPDLTSNGDEVFVSTRTFTSDGQSPQDSSWSTPTTYSLRTDGNAGTDGYNNATISLYHKNTSSSTPPADPTGGAGDDFTYSFVTGVLTVGSGNLNGWAQDAPDISSGEYLWMQQAIASSNTSNTTGVEASDFNTPQVVGIGGAAGSNAIQYYIHAPNGTALKNSQGSIDLEAYKIDGTSAALADSSDGVELYDTASRGLTENYTAADISGSLVVQLRETASPNTVLDTITIADFTDGLIAGSINADNGLAIKRTADTSTVSPTETILTAQFIDEVGTTHSEAIEIEGRFSGGNLQLRWLDTTPNDTDIGNPTVTRSSGASAIQSTWYTTDSLTAEFTFTSPETSNTIKALETVYITQEGDSGTNVATVSLFHKNTSSSTPPALFSGTFTYTFATGLLSDGTLNGWSQNAPDLSQGEYLWQSQAIASSINATDTVEADSPSDFNTPQVVGYAGQDGGEGTDGSATAFVNQYIRQVSTPAQPAGNSATYSFDSPIGLTPTIGWSVGVPAGSDPIWVSTAQFWSNDGTGSDGNTTWSTPQKLAEDGDPGTDGSASVYVNQYIRSASQPSTPTGGSYSFDSPIGFTPTSSWSEGVPAYDGDPVWVSTAQFYSEFGTGVDSDTTWSTPQKLAEDGAPGDDGTDALVVAYTNNNHTVPVTNLSVDDWTGSGGEVYVYEGATALTLDTNTPADDYIGLGNGEYKLYIEKISGDNLTIPSITGAGTTTATLADWNSPSTLSGVTVYRINAKVERLDGTQVTISTDVTFAPGDQGADGDDGDNALTLNYTNNAHVVPVTNLNVDDWTGSGGPCYVFEGPNLLTLDSNTQSTSSPSTNSRYRLDIDKISGDNLTEPGITGAGTTTATLADWNSPATLSQVTIYRLRAFIRTSVGDTATLTTYVTFAPGDQGADGGDGYNNATVSLFNKNTSGVTPPSDPTGGVGDDFTYNFTTGVLSEGSGSLNGWAQDAPDISAGEYLWMQQAIASDNTSTTTGVEASDFNTAQVVGIGGAQGNQGDAGINVATVSLFHKNTSDSTPPSGPTAGAGDDFTYTFSTGVLAETNGTLDGWAQDAPSLASGEYLWQKQAIASANTATDGVEASDFNTAQVIGYVAVDGTDGYAVSTTTNNGLGFTYDSAGNNPSPANTTITATGYNFSSPQYQFSIEGVGVQQSWGVDNTWAYTPESLYSNMPETVLIEAREGGSGAADATDSLTMVGLRDASDAVTVILTNEAHTIPVDKDGNNGDYTGSGTTIRVFEGATELAYDGVGTSPGTWTVSESGSSITPDNTPTDDGLSATYGVASNMTADTAAITFTISGERADGQPLADVSPFTIDKIQTFSKSYTGADGSQGTPGTAGDSVFHASVYLRKSSSPTEPVTDDGSYNFTTNTLTPPSISGGSADNWSISVPAGSDPLYVSHGEFSINGTTGTDSTVDWTAPVIMAQDGSQGDTGASGQSVYVAQVFLRKSTTPTEPVTNDGEYNFTTNTLTAPSIAGGSADNWSISVPAGSDPLYVSQGSFEITGATGTDSTVDWTAPQILASDGAAGSDGKSVYVASIFLRKGSAPTKPIDDDGSYNFTTNTLTAPSISGGSADDWFDTPPAGSNPLYVSTGTFEINGTTGTDSTVTWTTPAILVQDGAQGDAGQSVKTVNIYRKNSSSINSGSGTYADPLSGNSPDWSYSVPTLSSDGDIVYVSTRTFTSDGQSPQDANWSTPTIYSQRTDGTDAQDIRTVNIYQKNTSNVTPPSISSGSGSYDDPLSGNGSWSLSVPSLSSDGEVVWVSTRTFTSDGQSPQDANWATPTIYSQRIDNKVGWGHDMTFSTTSPTDVTVAWTSGTLKLADGTEYSIPAGNTTSTIISPYTDMSDSPVRRWYIYFDVDLGSPHDLVTTDTMTDAVGNNKILIAVAEARTDGTEAYFQVFGGAGGIKIAGDEVAANSIVANNIAGGNFEGKIFTGGTFETRAPNDGTSPYDTDPRAVMQGIEPYLGVYLFKDNASPTPDEDELVFGITEVNGQAQLTIVGDFAPDSLDTTQMFSDAAIDDLHGRLGTSAPINPTGGTAELPNLPVSIGISTEDNELYVDPNSPAVQAYNTGLQDNTLTFRIIDSDYYFGPVNQNFEAPNWDVTFYYTDTLASPLTWYQVPGANWTLTGTAQNQPSADPGEGLTWDCQFSINSTVSVVWNPTNFDSGSPNISSGSPIYYMVRTVQSSAGGSVNNPRIYTCKVTEPLVGNAYLTELLDDQTPELYADLDCNDKNLDEVNSIYLNEKASANDDITGDGQIWVKNVTPNVPMFTDDAGTDYQIGYGSYKVWINENVNINSNSLASEAVGAIFIKTDTTSRTLTLPADSYTTHWPVGSQITVYNRAGSVNITINDQATNTLYYMDGTTAEGTDVAGSCTIAPGGYATIIHESSSGGNSVSVIMGQGITA